MPKLVTITVVSLVVFGVCAPAGADSGNYFRDRVRAWEVRALENFLEPMQSRDLRTAPRIVGGVVAPAGAWPFQVALLSARVSDAYQAQFCGGTLVSAQFVVTAAHCVFGSTAAQIDVLTNTQTLDGSGVRHKIDSIKYHPRYNDRTTDFDIAILKLKTTTTNISVFARMLSKAEENEMALPGERAFVTGWGNLSGNGSNYPTTLRQVEVPLVSRDDCNDGNSYDGEITLRMICAGESNGGKDACDGDSGGPLIVRDEQGRWQILAGVVSWGVGCAEADLFGVYSRMAVLSNWARRTISTMGGPLL